MLDRKFLIANQKTYEENMRRRNSHAEYEVFAKLFYKTKELTCQLESLRYEQKHIKGFSSQAKELKEKIIELKTQLKEVQEPLNDWLLNQPNILDEEVPYGVNDKDNQIIFCSDIEKKESKPHYELIPNLIMENESVTLSGSRFLVLKEELAELKRALINFMLDNNKNHGYKYYDVPCIVNDTCFYGTGQFPKFQDDAFELENGQWLISTGEVPLVNLFGDKVFLESELPILATTYTPCFRKEAGSAGKDTKGIIRLHQFHKVELVTICKEEDASHYHLKQLETAKFILNALHIPCRVVLVCSGDIGFTAKKQYDIEMWMPGSEKFLEIASCSNCGDFQARRANIKYKDCDEEKHYVNTLNGSSLAIERLIAGIVENHYDIESNSIIIPQILRDYIKKNQIVL